MCIIVFLILLTVLGSIIGYLISYYLAHSISESTNWDHLESELNKRYNSICNIVATTNVPTATKSDFVINNRIVAIDSLIEKAQDQLTRRAGRYFESGIFLFSMAMVSIISFISFMYFTDEIVYVVDNALRDCGCIDSDFFMRSKEVIPIGTDSYVFEFILILIKRIVAGGAVLSFIYILFTNANSCFRESTTLLHRRHLLRYVRLLSYENNGKVETKDLRDIFGVDHATITGFDKIKVESIRDNLIGKLMDMIGKMRLYSPSDTEERK